MRLSEVSLSWFRGAADAASLPPKCKSIVVYGCNGSGKSSFVDAIEYALRGRVLHLAHEYSGKHQERALLNTHRPPSQKASIRITFADKSTRTITIDKAGAATAVSSAVPADAIQTWDYRRTILRQDEVARFIHDTKAQKYSALLPLLGLQPLEIAAENMRQLAKHAEQRSKARENAEAVKLAIARRKNAFGTESDDEIRSRVVALYAMHCPGDTSETTTEAMCAAIEAAIKGRMSTISAENRVQAILAELGTVKVSEAIDTASSAVAALGTVVEPFIAEKLSILRSVRGFVGGSSEHEIVCPACGRPIASTHFQEHLQGETKRLQSISDAFDTRSAALIVLSDALKSAKKLVASEPLGDWRTSIAVTAEGAARLKFLGDLDPEAIRTDCGAILLVEIRGAVVPLVQAAAEAAGAAMPSVATLTTDKQIAADAAEALNIAEVRAEAERAALLVGFLQELEGNIRDELKRRAATIIANLCAHIQKMWTLLHPGEAIEDVTLYMPISADKAIDIGLKFYGKELESPRLTLSEGYRNSLGLCIFLAMAAEDLATDRPLVLDDVVISLDRDHRGMIAELLEQEFSNRQVILLTHDRDWYAELRRQLDQQHWSFVALLPYESPEIGIRWASKQGTFDDARALLDKRPDAAGNDARKIMDSELAAISERLEVRLPFMRGERNDRRMAHDFLERLQSEGKKCWQRKQGTEYIAHGAGVLALQKADTLILSWGNKASHSTDVTKGEAGKLIDACETAIRAFDCPGCGKGIWYARVESQDLVQCQCGEFRWRYGKA